MRTSRIAATKARLLLIHCRDLKPAPLPEFEPDDRDPRPEMLCYRRQTLALVRNFFELSSQVGRVCSLLGREFFRARVSHHTIPSFEEQALFIRDLELCLSLLRKPEAEVIVLLGVYDLPYDQAALRLHSSPAVLSQQFTEALDRLSEIFLERGVLREDRPDRRQLQLSGEPVPPEVVGNRKKPPASVRCIAERPRGAHRAVERPPMR